MARTAIIKLDHTSETQKSFEGVKINKIVSSISPLSLIKLLKVADNEINPRAATVNPITKAIDETLAKSPELFWYKSKGIFIATKSLRYRERNRVELSFEDPLHEGIMDGGHNTFAIARYIANKLYGAKFRTWDECKDFWEENYDDLLARFEESKGSPDFQFSIPVEIIFPSDQEGAMEQYYEVISEICTARNNNVQLTTTSKSHQLGCYSYLEEKLSGIYDIEWRDGEGGAIDLTDITAMACIPLYFLQTKGLLPSDLKTYNRINAYSQKGQCVSFFKEVMTHPNVSHLEEGKVVVDSPCIKSALDMTEDLMKLFDRIYIQFPYLYNRNGGSFGNINAVNAKGKKRGMAPDSDYNKSTPLFRTTTKRCDYTYPDGFIYPLITGITQFMKYDDTTNTIQWILNPNSHDFDMEALPLKLYVNSIKEMGYDPQKVGKKDFFYEIADMAYENYLRIVHPTLI